jgi:hypothetical protein
VSKRAWLIFGVVQILGCIAASYGTVYSESAFVRGSWFCGLVLLLPGNLPALVLSEKLWHVRTAYIFFPVAVACNAVLWVTCSLVSRILRCNRPWGWADRFVVAFAVTGLVFVVANTGHFLRPVTCYDCFYPYGVPFIFYREGGFAGGGGFVLRGLAADTLTLLVSALLLGGFWHLIAAKGS